MPAFYLKDERRVCSQTELGDVLVTLIIQAQGQGTNLEECLALAYNKIKYRTGKTIDGVFVKSEDL